MSLIVGHASSAQSDHSMTVQSWSTLVYDGSARLLSSRVETSVVDALGTVVGDSISELGSAANLDLGVAAKTGPGALRALSTSERTTLDDALRPDKLGHIFDPKHNFDPLVQQFGSREAAMEQIVRNIGGPLPQKGPFQVARSIGGQDVYIRGSVVDGIPRIGTAYTP